MKKLLLGLGTVAAIFAPVATVVACGNSGTPFDGYTEGGFNFKITMPKTFNPVEFTPKLSDASNQELQNFIGKELKTAGGTFSLVSGTVPKSYKFTLSPEDITLDFFYNSEYRSKIIKSDDPTVELNTVQVLSVTNSKELKYKQAVADISKVSLSDLGISFDMDKIIAKFFSISNPTRLTKSLLSAYANDILAPVVDDIKSEIWKALEPVVNNGDLSQYALAKLNSSFPGVKYQIEKGYEPQSNLTGWTKIVSHAGPIIPTNWH